MRKEKLARDEERPDKSPKNLRITEIDDEDSYYGESYLIHSASPMYIHIDDAAFYEEEASLDEYVCAFLGPPQYGKNITFRYGCGQKVEFRVEGNIHACHGHLEHFIPLGKPIIVKRIRRKQNGKKAN